MGGSAEPLLRAGGGPVLTEVLDPFAEDADWFADDDEGAQELADSFWMPDESVDGLVASDVDAAEDAVAPNVNADAGVVRSVVEVVPVVVPSVAT